MPRPQPHTISDNMVAGVIVVAGALWSMLWASAALTSRLSGQPAPPASLSSPIEAFAHAGNPAIACGHFWQASAEQAVRCLLHAAALGRRTSTDLYNWSLVAVQAPAPPPRLRRLAPSRARARPARPGHRP